MTDHAKIAQRFYSKVNIDVTPGACWNWLGGMSGSGYGTFYLNGHMVGAHRAAWLLEHGPLPDGFVIDHLCRNPPCVRTAHLEPVSPRTNARRGLAGARNRAKTHCRNGHPYDGSNTICVRRVTGSRAGLSERRCRICQRDAAARYRARATS